MRNFDDLPSLPNGYWGMFLVAMVPPLWFRVMNPRLLEYTQRDPERIHFHPKRRQALCERYELETKPEIEAMSARAAAA